MSSGILGQIQSLLGMSPAKRLAKAGDLAAKARLKADSDPAAAINLYTKAIEILEKLNLGKDSQAPLGAALLSRGKLQEKTRNTAGALASYVRAKQILPSVPQPVLLFIAASLAAAGDTKTPAINIYLDLLREFRNQAKPEGARGAYDLLEKQCVTTEAAAAKEAEQKLSLLHSVIDADPKLDWAHYYAGIVHFGRKQYDHALTCFQRASVLQCTRPLVAFYLAFANGKCLVRNQRQEEALEAFRQAARKAPQRPEACHETGRLLVELCQKAPPETPERRRWLEEAAENLEQAARLDPRQAEYVFYLGRAQELAGKASEAAKSFEQACRLDKTRADYFLHLGRCCFALGSLKEAAVACRSAIALDARHMEARRLLGEISLASKDFEAAAGEFQICVTANPADEGDRAKLGLALYSLNRFQEAVKVLEPAPQSELAEFYLARCYAQMDRFDMAAKILGKLAGGQSTNFQAFYYLALAQAHQGRFEDALKTFEEAIRIGGAQPQCFVQRGNVYVKLGRLSEAAVDYGKALQLQPADPDLLYQAACVSRALGDEDAAISYLARLVVLVPAHVPARLARGSLHEKRSQLEEALADYGTAAKLDPKNARVRRRLGVVRCQLEAYKKSLAELKEAIALGDDSDECLYYFGLAGTRCEEFKAALDAWTKLGARHPEDRRLALNLNRLHYCLGKQHLGAGRFREAIGEWTLYLEPRPDDEAMKKEIAKLHFRSALAECTPDGKGGAASARSSLKQAVALDPENPVYRYYLALEDAFQGRWHDYLAAAGPLIPKLSPKARPLAMLHLGIGWLVQNDLAKAESLLVEARTEAEKAGVTLNAGWCLAVVYAKSGRWEEAAELLSREPKTQADQAEAR